MMNVDKRWIALVVVLLTLIGIRWAAAQGRNCSSLSGDPYDLGTAALLDGNFEGAMISFGCAIAADPSSVDAYGGLIEAEIRGGAYMLALEHAESMKGASGRGRLVFGAFLAGYRDRIVVTPDDPYLYLMRGFYNSMVENEDAAARDAERAIERDPNIPFSYVLRGSINVYGNTAEVETALADFAQAAELSPENASIYEYAAIMCEDAIEPECAAEYIARAFEIGITAQSSYISRAKISDLIGEHERAAPDYLTYIELFAPERVDGGGLESGQPVILTIEAGHTYQLAFDATAGEEVTFRTESDFHFIDPVMALLAPDGSPLRGSDDAYNIFDSAVYNFVPQTSGTYTVLVTTYNGAYSGEISVIAERVN